MPRGLSRRGAPFENGAPISSRRQRGVAREVAPPRAAREGIDRDRERDARGDNRLCEQVIRMSGLRRSAEIRDAIPSFREVPLPEVGQMF